MVFDLLWSSGFWIQRKYTTVSSFKQENSRSNRLFEIVDAVVYGPPPTTPPTGQYLPRLDQVGSVTAWAAEEASNFGLGVPLFRPDPNEDAGG